jgi:hypothetical protein
MPIDFPSSPTTGQVYTYLGKSWVYNGTGWDVPRALSEIGAVQTFANATARTAAIPSPTEGIVTYLNDTDRLDVHNGTAFVPALSTGAWVSYTPTLTNVTLGNGSISAKYNVIGKTMHIQVKLTLGSTSSVTGAPRVSLPSGFTTATANFAPIGMGLSAVAGVAYTTQTLVLNSSTIYSVVMVANGTYVSVFDMSSVIPGTWTTGSLLELHATLELA